MIVKLKYGLLTFVTIALAVYVFFSLQDDDEPQYFKFIEYKETFNKSHIFDLDFNYLINNNCSKNGAIKLLKGVQIVTSFAGNVEARSALRRAYPKNELEKLGIYRVFLLAMLRPGDSEVTQNAIINENERFNDIVQGNFYENYRNLTYKHIMGVRWAVTECQVQYVIKMDDDIVVDMYSLRQLINSKEKANFDFLGLILKEFRPIRVTANKWYVTKEEFDLETYPTFVSGWLYVLNMRAAEKLLVALKYERYFWIDDVFVTGILAQRANLTHEDIKEYITANPEYFECCMRDKVKCGFIAGPSGKDYNINIDFQKHSKLCHKTNCSEYTNGKTFKNSCVVRRKLPPLGKGFAKLNVIKL